MNSTSSSSRILDVTAAYTSTGFGCQILRPGAGRGGREQSILRRDTQLQPPSNLAPRPTVFFQCQRLKPQLFADQLRSTKLHLPRLRGRYPIPIPRSASAGALRAGGLVGQSLRSTQSGRALLVSLGKCQRRTLRGTANDRATDKDASAVFVCIWIANCWRHDSGPCHARLTHFVVEHRPNTFCKQGAAGLQ